MQNKNMAYRARILTWKAMAEPNVAVLLEELAAEKPMVFLQAMDTAYLAAQLTETYRGFQGDPMDLVRGALLHDVGMLSVPDEIVLKQGRLDPEESAVVRGHVQAGLDMVADMGFSPLVLDTMRSHHERADGSGYPNGYESPAIPRSAKIVAACDVYEALTTDRPQRKAFNLYEATDLMSTMPLSQAVLMAIKACDDI